MPPEDQPTDLVPPPDALMGNSFSGLLYGGGGDSFPDSKAEIPDNWEPPSPEHIGQLLPQYQIEGLIGRGGMGAVYKGRQITLQRPVAIKILPAELARSSEFVGRFHREAQLLASLSHPGIVTIFDFGQTTEGHLFFIMEYVDGTDLNRLIRDTQQPLDPKLALSLTMQICEAMQYAHDNGVIHRDIKPANVLVTKDGRAKLADFGLAMKPTEPDAAPAPPRPGMNPQHYSPDVAGLRFTQPGAAMGTPGYAAPEVYEGKADERSDIYALGIMLYEMLTGAPPEGYFPLPSARTAVDHRVDQVVIKALEIDPVARYQKVAEMKADVAAATQPLAKKSITPSPRVTKVVPQKSNVITASRPPTAPVRPTAKRPNRSALGSLIWVVLVSLAVGIAYDAGQQWKISLDMVSRLEPRVRQFLKTSAAAKSTKASLPADAVPFQNKRYRVYRERCTWEEARRLCVEHGGQLAVLSNALTWRHLRPMLGDSRLWLGASDTDSEGTWRWIDGTPFTFTAWRSGEARGASFDEDYLFTDATGWADTANQGPDGTLPNVDGYLCEWNLQAAANPEITSPIDPISGRWIFFNDSVRTFLPDGTSTDEVGQKADWRCVNPAPEARRYEVSYEGGKWRDTLTMRGGFYLEGLGLGGIKVTAHRVSAPVKLGTTASDVTNEAEAARKLRETLLKNRWHYTDLGWPSSTVGWYADGTFHPHWHWRYWIIGPQEIHVQFGRGAFKPAGGDRFTLDESLTRFECPHADGRRRIVGTRL